jgi:molybdopterin/thiamine biosynthesis adenylyltransferase
VTSPQPRLVVPAGVVDDLRDALLRADGDERFAFVYCGDQGRRLLASRVVAPDDDQMAVTERTACRPDPAFERECIGTCVEEQLAPLLVHSHPFAESPAFSGRDIARMDDFRGWLTGLYDDPTYGFAVLGQSDAETVVDVDGQFADTRIEVLAPWKLDAALPSAVSRFDPSDRGRSETRDRGAEDDAGVADTYDRNVRAVTEDGQRRLSSAAVAVVGAGGVGSMVAEQLVRLGVTDLLVVDPDEVESTNLPRTVGAYDHHVGKPKVDALREHLWQSSPTDDATIATAHAPVEDVDERLDDYDLVVGCVDRVSTRSFLNEYAVKHLTYYVDAGVRIDVGGDGGERTTTAMTGYVQLVAPGATACFDCLGRHAPGASHVERLSPEEREAERERGYIADEALAPEPAVVHLNGVVASKAVSVVSKLVTGHAEPPDFVRYEDLESDMTELTTEPSERCPTCGEDGLRGVGRRSFGSVETAVEDDAPATTTQ